MKMELFGLNSRAQRSQLWFTLPIFQWSANICSILRQNLCAKILDGLLVETLTQQSNLIGKSNDCGRILSYLEWCELINTFQVHNTFVHQSRPRFSWNNGQLKRACRLALLDRFYIAKNSCSNFHHKAYFTHRYAVGSDHSQYNLRSLQAMKWPGTPCLNGIFSSPRRYKR